MASKIAEDTDQQIFNTYVTDTLMNINTILATHYGGKAINRRYYDIIFGKKVEEKSGEEIVVDIINRAGLKVTDNECI